MSEVRMTSGLLSISVVIWICMYVLSKPFTLFNNPAYGKYKSRNFNIYSVLFFLFCIFAFSEYDTYHTWNDFLNTKSSKNLLHYEPIYRWISDVVGMNYFMWRFCVWGVAVGSIFYLSKLLKDRTFGLMFSITMLLPMSYFVATRGSSGHALALLGITLMFGGEPLYDRKRLLALVLIVASLFLHRSNFMFIGLILISLITPLRNKRIILLSIFAYPLLSSMITHLLDSFVSGGFEIAMDDNMNIQEKAMRYAGGEKKEYNANGFLAIVVYKLPYVLITAYLTVRICFQEMTLPKIYVFYYKFSYVCVYLAMLLFFQETSSWMFERIMFMGLFPMCLVFSKVMQYEKKHDMFFRYIWLSLMLSISYSVLYKFYIN